MSSDADQAFSKFSIFPVQFPVSSSSCGGLIHADNQEGHRSAPPLLLLLSCGGMRWFSPCFAMSTFVPLSSRLRLCLRRAEGDLPARWLSASRDSGTAGIEDVKKSRLHHHLEELGVCADDLEDAYVKSVATSEGYSTYFGKPAIKAYKSYFKQKAGEDIDVAANRFARQIDCESAP